MGIQIDLPDWAPREAGQAYPLSAYDESLRGHVVYPPAFAAVSSRRGVLVCSLGCSVPRSA